MISEKKNERYSEVVRYLRVKLSFMALKSTLLWLRGSRSVKTVVNRVVSDLGLAKNWDYENIRGGVVLACGNRFLDIERCP